MSHRIKFVLRATGLICICVSVILYSRSYGNTNTRLCSIQDYSETNTSVMYSIGPKGDEKYRQLIQEALRSYQHYHHVKRRELVRGRSSRTLTWYCVSGCGGIGDRVKGMQASFLLAMVTNRTFFIHMSNEVQKTMYLEPNAIDWRPVNSCVEMPQEHNLANFGRSSNLFVRKFHLSKWNTSLELNRVNKVEHLYVSNKEKIKCMVKNVLQSNIGLNLGSLHRKLFQLLLDRQLDNEIHNIFNNLYHFLFKTPQLVKTLAQSNLDRLKLEENMFVTVHIRTGFKSRVFGEFVLSFDFLKQERFARTEDSWRDMIECALNISDSMFGSNSKILLVSDDKEPKTWAASIYKSRIVMLDVDPVHVSDKVVLVVFEPRPLNMYLDTWVELSVMSESAALVGIKSGYFDVASYIGNMDYHSLYTYSIHDRTCTSIQRYLVETK